MEVPDASAQPPEVHEALVEARGSLDRVEEILAMAMVLRSGAEARAKELTETADDALDKALWPVQRAPGSSRVPGSGWPLRAWTRCLSAVQPVAARMAATGRRHREARPAALLRAGEAAR